MSPSRTYSSVSTESKANVGEALYALLGVFSGINLKED